ncbi:MAG: flagellin FliC [Alteromonadaceae bacterium]|nr:flagellin FliC [Alteromonadaceae bacterium]
MITIGTMVNNRNGFFQLRKSEQALFDASAKLISGKRINSAKDDPSGLARANLLTSQIRSNNQSIRNANDGISLTQVADSALAGANDTLQRIRELAVQASNGTLNDANRKTIQTEINQLTEQLGDIGDNTKFNGINVFEGSGGNGNTLNIQVGFNQSISLELGELSISSLSDGLNSNSSAANVANVEDAGNLIENIDSVISQIGQTRSSLGATQSRFLSTINNLSESMIQSQSARSIIEDADYARSISEFIQARLAQQVSNNVFVKSMEAEKAFISQLIGG